MSLVVLNIECIEKKILKEVGVYKNGKTVGYSFLPSKKFKATSQSAWCTIGTVAMKIIMSLKKN